MCGTVASACLINRFLSLSLCVSVCVCLCVCIEDILFCQIVGKTVLMHMVFGGKCITHFVSCFVFFNICIFVFTCLSMIECPVVRLCVNVVIIEKV